MIEKQAAPRWISDFVLLGIGVLGAMAMNGITPVLPTIQDAFGGTASAALQVNLLVTIVGLAMVIGSPLAGVLGRLIGPGAVLLWSLLFYAVAGLAPMFLDSLPLMIASRFVLGLASACGGTIVIALIATLYQGTQRERRIGANLAIGSVSAMAVVPLCGWLGDIDWHLAFLPHLLVLPFLLALPFCPMLWVRAPAAAAADGPVAPRRWPLLLMLVALLSGSVIFSTPVLLPFRLREAGFPGAGLAGQIFTILVIGSILTSAFYGEVRRRFAAAQIFAIGYALYAAGLAVLGFGNSLPMLALGLGIAGFGGGLISPSLFSAAGANPDPEQRAHDVGLVKGSYFAGLFVGPLAMQAAAESIAVAGAVLILAGLAAALCLAWTLLPARAAVAQPGGSGVR